MIKVFALQSKENLFTSVNLFKALCSFQYRRKIKPDLLPYQERFLIGDGQYLIPRPPLKPLTAYNVFTLMYMKIIRENYPNEPTSVILKKLSSLWNDDEFMIDHKLEVLNLSKFQSDLYYKEMMHYKKTYLKPKEPLSPYQIYLKEQYAIVQQELKTNDLSDITAHVTANWHKLPREQQLEYTKIFKSKFSTHRETVQAYENVFRIPIKKSKNIYNIYLTEHFKDKKIKFNSTEEHSQYTKELQNIFNQLGAEEKVVYEKMKIEQDNIHNEQVEKFKKFFDLSEQDYIDICKDLKSQQKNKDHNSIGEENNN